MASNKNMTLHHHITAVKKGERLFENAFQGVSRMVLEGKIDKVLVNGKTTFDFTVFRAGKKHIIGMYDEINSFVSFVKDAAAREAAERLFPKSIPATGIKVRGRNQGCSSPNTLKASEAPKTAKAPDKSENVM